MDLSFQKIRSEQPGKTTGTNGQRQSEDREVEVFPKRTQVQAARASASKQDDKDIMSAVENEQQTYQTTAFLMPILEGNDDADPIYQQEEIQSYQQQEAELEGAINTWCQKIDNIIEEYFPNKNLEDISDGDIQKAIFINSLEEKNSAYAKLIQDYMNSQGAIDSVYNFAKDFADIGLTPKEIEQYYENEKMFSLVLSSAVKNDGQLELVDNNGNLSQEELLEQGQLSQEAFGELIATRLSACDNIEDLLNYTQNYLDISEKDTMQAIVRSALIYEVQHTIYSEGVNPDDITVELEEDENGNLTIKSDSYLVSETYNGMSVDEFFKNYSFISKDECIKGISEDLKKLISQYTPKNLSFDKLYSLYTGVEYNQEAIDKANSAKFEYEQVTGMVNSAQYQEILFQNMHSPIEALNYFKEVYDFSDEEAAQFFNNYYDSFISQGYTEGANDWSRGLEITSYHISPDGKTAIEEYKVYDEYLNGDHDFGEGYIYDSETGTVRREVALTTVDKSGEETYIQFLNSPFIAINNNVKTEGALVKNIKENLNGKYDEIVENYYSTKETAFGKNILNEKFEEYRNDMDSYSSKISSAIAMTGFALSFVNPVAGLGALAGAYTDNAIDLVNLATNKKDGELGNWTKDTLKDMLYTAVGFTLGGLANQGGHYIATKALEHGASAITATGTGLASEYILDVGTGFAFDVLTSYLETGDINLSGNLLNNLIFGAADFKGGVGLYRALNGQAMDFDIHTKLSDTASDANTRAQADEFLGFNWNRINQTDDFGCADIATLNALAEKPMIQQALEQKIDYDANSHIATFEYAGETWKISNVDPNSNMIEILHNAYLAYNPDASEGDFVNFVTKDLLGENSRVHVSLNSPDIDMGELSRLSSDEYTIMTLSGTDTVELESGAVIQSNHAYTVSRVNEDGSMILKDPYNPNEEIAVSINDYNILQNAEITGASLTRGLDDGIDSGMVNGLFGGMFRRNQEAQEVKPKYSTIIPDTVKEFYLENCEGMGIKPKSDKYLAFYHCNDITSGKYGLGDQHPIWRVSMAGEGNNRCAWKMHIYSTETDDFINLANNILPYLQEEGIHHKMLSEYKSPEELGGVQRGKSITIYPQSIEEMERAARGLERIIKEKGLTLPSSQIAGDANLGNTGRLFYRYELNTGALADAIIGPYDISHYDGNRVRMAETLGIKIEYPHLALDMQDGKLDIWRNFDPSDPNSHPASPDTAKEAGNAAQRAQSPIADEAAARNAAQRPQSPNMYQPQANEIIRKNLVNPEAVIPTSQANTQKTVKTERGQHSIINLNSATICLGADVKGGYTLDLTTGKIREMLEQLDEGEKLTIGRQNCEYLIPRDCIGVSRNHGYFTRQDGQIYFVDTSMNGTYIRQNSQTNTPNTNKPTRVKTGKNQAAIINLNSATIRLGADVNGGYTLDLTTGKIRELLEQLDEGEKLTIGRQNCEYLIPRDCMGVSRNHGYFTRQDGQIYFIDTSMNGTYIEQ